MAKTVEELFDDVRQTKAEMDCLRGLMAQLAQRRAQSLAQLRGLGVPVAEIAARLGITPAAVYKARDDTGVGATTISTPDIDLDDLRGRVASQLSIVRDIRAGRTPPVMSPHGWQLLENVLAEMFELLTLNR